MEMFLNGFVLGVLTVGIGCLLKVVIAEYELYYRKRKARLKSENIKTVHKAIMVINGKRD